MIYEIKNLTFSYSASERKVLDSVALSLDEGEILCILGPNGAGKTTLLSCMAGLLKPELGEIELCGKSLSSMKEKNIARVVGYVPQLHTPAFDYTAFDFVLMGRAPETGMFGRPSDEDEKMVMDVLESMNLAHLANKSYMNISGGERQQLLIARAIVREPKVVLFDEPVAHLDYGNQQRVLELVKSMANKGLSVVITTHNPDHALLLGGKAAIVDRQGKIIQGNTDDILTEDALKKIYDTDLRIMWIEELGRKACLVPEL